MTYLENQPLFPKYDRWIDFALGCPKPILFAHYEAVIENYAQIVAKYHVLKALEAASEKAYCSMEHPDEENGLEESDYIVNKNSILNAYKV